MNKRKLFKKKAQPAAKMSQEVTVNVGKLLEDNLKKWKGKGHHVRGIAEYIANSDDSYRRLNKFTGQKITVEIISNRKRGKKLDKVVITDWAEGMSFDDLKDKFFQYFESYSGREQGLQVSGQFGTGGKAYAIMNFKTCWITSVKDGQSNKAWFKWDSDKKKILYDFTQGGHKNKRTSSPNGTTIELLASDNNTELSEFVIRLNETPRIRQAVKSQNIDVIVTQGSIPSTAISLEYLPEQGETEAWTFPLPTGLSGGAGDNDLVIRYFNRKEGARHNWIDVQDGITTVVDLPIKQFDGRPFSKYLSGEVTIEKLRNSSAVKENRKGLEEGDDLTIEIESFLKGKVTEVIDKIQEAHRLREKEKNIAIANGKINELNKFLHKCELNFRDSLSEIKSKNSNQKAGLAVAGVNGSDSFRHPTDTDDLDSLVPGTWTNNGRGGGTPGPNPGPGPNPEPSKGGVFVEDPDGDGRAVKGDPLESPTESGRKKRGLQVLMTDDEDSPVPASEYPEWEEPVIDRFLLDRGIILVNVNNPIIAKSREREEYQHIFNERVANYVLLIVAQYQTQRELAVIGEDWDEPQDQMLIFRQKFFSLQRDLRDDREINYFEDIDEETTEMGLEP